MSCCPPPAWGEKDGTVTNSERRISRQRAFLPPPGEARPDWWIVAEVAPPHGLRPRPSPTTARPTIFREHAALSAFENDGARDFDLAGLAGIDDRSYDALAPVQWPVRGDDGRPALRRRALLHRRRPRPVRRRRRPRRRAAAPPEFPLVLNTGRVARPVAHHDPHRPVAAPRRPMRRSPSSRSTPTMRRRAASLPATLVELRSPHGRVTGRALITDGQRRGSVFVPMHWTDQFAEQRPRRCAGRRRGPTRSRASRRSSRRGSRRAAFAAAWYGFAVLRDRPASIAADYWALARAEGGWRVELAGRQRAGGLDGVGPRAPARGRRRPPRLSRRGERPSPLRRLRRRAARRRDLHLARAAGARPRVPRRRADRRARDPGRTAPAPRRPRRRGHARSRRDGLLLLRRRRRTRSPRR